MRRIRLAGRRHGCEIEPLARLRTHLRRVDQAVAAHPDAVIGLWQVRDEIAALILGNHDAPELGRQLGGLSDDPHTRFATLGAGDNAADVLSADRDRRDIFLRLAPGWNRYPDQQRRGRKETWQPLSDLHEPLPAGVSRTAPVPAGPSRLLPAG